jgi:hypothetical protein
MPVASWGGGSELPLLDRNGVNAGTALDRRLRERMFER